MIELADPRPVVTVEEGEYTRLLGYPRGQVLDGRAAELAGHARTWYAEHGHPWMYARQAGSLGVEDRLVRIDGEAFAASRLRESLLQSQAHGVVLVAVGAGPELEAEAARLWEDGKPDEYYFLEVYGSAVVEHLMAAAGARLCAWAEGQEMAVLPHDSPGYTGWDIGEQPQLLAVLTRPPGPPLPGPVEALGSGALRPKKSQLAVFGLTRHTDRARRLTDLVPCESCSFGPCQYRRAPYRRPPARVGSADDCAR
jgi:hypothetical protein